MTGGYWLGVDLGGTKILAAIFDDNLRLLARSKQHTSAEGGPEGVMGRIVQGVEAVIHEANVDPLHIRGMGLGIPGQIVVGTTRVKFAPNLEWRDVDVQPLVPAGWHWPLVVDNDVRMGTYGEFAFGAAKGARNVLGVFVGTGVGGGLILDGKLHRGAHGTSGEIGHMIIDPNGPLDLCGQRGCLEAFIGGANIARETGHTAAELFAAAAKGNKHARMVVERAARYMGMALISLTNVIDPEMFVIGGGVSRSWALVEPTIVETLHSSPFIKPARRPRLRRARLGDRAGQIGAVEWARINQ